MMATHGIVSESQRIKINEILTLLLLEGLAPLSSTVHHFQHCETAKLRSLLVQLWRCAGERWTQPCGIGLKIPFRAGWRKRIKNSGGMRDWKSKVGPSWFFTFFSSSQVFIIFRVKISFRNHFENVSLIFPVVIPRVVSEILHTRLKTFPRI